MLTESVQLTSAAAAFSPRSLSSASRSPRLAAVSTSSAAYGHIQMRWRESVQQAGCVADVRNRSEPAPFPHQLADSASPRPTRSTSDAAVLTASASSAAKRERPRRGAVAHRTGPKAVQVSPDAASYPRARVKKGQHASQQEGVIAQQALYCVGDMDAFEGECTHRHEGDAIGPTRSPSSFPSDWASSERGTGLLSTVLRATRRDVQSSFSSCPDPLKCHSLCLASCAESGGNGEALVLCFSA